MVVSQMMEQQPFHRTRPMNQSQHHHMRAAHHHTMNTTPHQVQHYQHYTDVQPEPTDEALSTQPTIPIVIPIVTHSVFT